MTAPTIEREIAADRAPALAPTSVTRPGVSTPMSEYAPTVVADGDKLEKTGSRSSKGGNAGADHDGLGEKREVDPLEAAAAQAQRDAESGILTGPKLYLVFFSLMLAVFVSRLSADTGHVADHPDVCARPVYRRDRDPRHRVRLPVLHPGRMDVSHSYQGEGPC